MTTELDSRLQPFGPDAFASLILKFNTAVFELEKLIENTAF
ncbi:MAG: hypothetical protein KatS3mg006_0781 [Pyrinomonadaceae bacterium]|nr:MAG: hypothetical protein KatS3mg006_0781 [Pyrinomonadaceae bacterium]